MIAIFQPLVLSSRSTRSEAYHGDGETCKAATRFSTALSERLRDLTNWLRGLECGKIILGDIGVLVALREPQAQDTESAQLETEVFSILQILISI
jgi:hypothetical protein